MISYDTRNWLSALALHRSDTFRKLLPLLVLLGAFTWGVGYLETKYLKLAADAPIRNLPAMHALLGFAISMLLVFRTNTAYDRWWEGRRLWGELVNTSRNVVVKLDVMVPRADAATRTFFGRLVGRFALELCMHLRSEKTRRELDDAALPELDAVDRTKHVPTQLVTLMLERVKRLRDEGVIDGDEWLVLNPELTKFLDICGACERIKNTPIPYSYSSFLKKFIVIYVITLPFGYVFSLSYFAVPVVVFVFYVLASLELIAEEIEDPFGGDANDLPLERLARMIEQQALERLG